MIDTCKNIFTFGEATELWGLSESALRNRCNRGGLTSNGLKEGNDFKKSGPVWLITKMAMQKVYGPQKYLVEYKKGERILVLNPQYEAYKLRHKSRLG